MNVKAFIAVNRRLLLLTTIAASLSACGVTYTSPSVRQDDPGTPVTVVPMNMATITQANTYPYEPRALPQAFYAQAQARGLRTSGALPSPPDLTPEVAEKLTLNPPPNAPVDRYRIGVGDVVLFATRGPSSDIEQLSGLLAAQNKRQGYTVRDDGTISIPEIGAVEVGEMTLADAEDQIFKVLVDHKIDPSFSLEIAEFKARRVVVGGAVGAETIVPVTLTPPTLAEALVNSGGIKGPTEYTTIRVFRGGQLFQIPLRHYRENQDLQNIKLIDGDAVYVDQTFDPEKAMRFYERQLDVIALRGDARERTLAALRTEFEISKTRLDEQRTNFQARAELDAVPRDFIYLAGEVEKQARVPLPFERQATLADVLFDKGGFETTTGDASEIYVLRADTAAKVTAYHLDAGNIANMVNATRFQMRPNDIVFVEEQPITKWGRALQQLFPVLTGAAAGAL